MAKAVITFVNNLKENKQDTKKEMNFIPSLDYFFILWRKEKKN